MASLGSLFVNFEADTSKWTAGVNQVLRDSKELEKQIKGTTKVFTEIGAIMSGVGVAIVGTLTAAAKSAANYGDAIRDASIRTGLTVEALSGLKFAAEQSGTSFEALQTGLRRFSTNVQEAANGTKTQIKLFKDLGISVKDSAGQLRPVEDLIGDVADAFNKMPEGVTKAATAVKLFGRSGTELIELLASGKIGLQQFRTEAERLGLVIGQDTADQADKFNDSLKGIQGAIKGLEIVVGNALLPSLTSLALKITDLIVDFNNFARAHAGLIDVAFKLGAIIGTGGSVFLGIAGLLVLLPKLTTAFNALTLAIAKNPFGFIVIGVTTAIVALITFRNEIAGGVAKAIGFLATALAELFDKLAAAAGTVGLTKLSSQASHLGNTFRVTAADLKDMGNVLLAGEPIIADNTTLLAKYQQTHLKLPPAINDTTDASKKLTESFMASLRPADDLNKDLAVLMKQFSNQEIISVYGKKITEAEEAQREHGFEVKGATAELEKQIVAMHQWAAQLIVMNNAARTFASALPTELPILQPGQVPGMPLPPIGTRIDFDQFGQEAADAVEKFNREQKKIADAAKAETEKLQQVWSHAMGEIVADFAKAVTDIILKGGSLVNRLKDIGMQAAKSFTQAFILELFSPLEKAFTQLGETIAKKLQTTIFSKLTDLIPGIGPSGINQIAGQAAGAGQAVGGAGNAASAASGGITAAVGAIGSVVGAIGSIGGIFQQKRLEGTMNAVEFNTRASRIHLEVIIDQYLLPIKFSLQNILTFAGEQVNQLDAIYNRLTPGVAIPALASGGFMTETGLILAHAGETVSSRSQSNNIVMNLNLNIEGADVRDPRQFATQIMENIDREIMTGNRGWLQRWGTQFSRTAGNTTSSPRANR